MAARKFYREDGFENILVDGKEVGFAFDIKAQYYRGFTLSILRDLKIKVDDKEYDRESVRITVNGETFTLEECRTVIDPEYRWEFGEYARVSVMSGEGLKKGKHTICCHQIIAPSYMPFEVEADCIAEFEIQ